MQGVAVLSSKLRGYVLFTQKDSYVEIEVHITNNNMKKELLKVNGFHIHKSGDLRRGCDSCCSHYNPMNKTHGGLQDKNSHAGDLGNIVFDKEGNCNMILQTDKFTVQEIIGRSIIIHEQEDDLGKGGNEDSLKTGNAGKRIACSVIGYSESSCE
jgi:Cu-Zn family superoxide dismutase